MQFWRNGKGPKTFKKIKKKGLKHKKCWKTVSSILELNIFEVFHEKKCFWVVSLISQCFDQESPINKSLISTKPASWPFKVYKSQCLGVCSLIGHIIQYSNILNIQTAGRCVCPLANINTYRYKSNINRHIHNYNIIGILWSCECRSRVRAVVSSLWGFHCIGS